MTSIIPPYSMQHALKLVLTTTFILCASVALRGQSATQSELVVKVVDASGANVPAVQVEVTSVAGLTRTQTTAADGSVRFGNLPPDTYNIRVTQIGFATRTRTITLTAGQAGELVVELSARLLNRVIAATANLSTPAPVVEQDVLSALPNLNNDLTPFLQVVPGAVPIGSSALGTIVFDGKGREQQISRLDGLDATPLVDLPAGDGAMGVVDSFLKPSVAQDVSRVRRDSTNSRDEVTATKTGAFGSAFGPGSSSVIEGYTYSYGSNKQWRFQAYERLLNDALNARNFFDYEGKNAIRRSMFGGQAGGPISKRAGLFFAYEGTRGRTEQNLYEAVPVDAACNCASGRVAPFLAGYLPADTTTIVSGASLNPDFLIARRHVRTTTGANAWNARLDSTDKSAADDTSFNAYNFRFTRQAVEALVPDGVTGRQQRQRLVLANALARATLTQGRDLHVFKLGLNQSAARIDVELGAGTDPRLAQSSMTLAGTVDTVGLPLATQTVAAATLGGLGKSVGRGFALNPAAFIAGYDFRRVSEDTRHTLMFGLEARYIRLNYDRLGGLTYAFPSVGALRAGTPSTVNFSSDLSAPSPFTTSMGARQARQQFLLGYVQMQSKFRGHGDVPPPLTLTYGLRYDYFGPVHERAGRAVVVDPQTGELLPAKAAFYHASKTNFEPRLGLAYNWKSNKYPFFADTLINAGIGVYSGVPRIGDMLLPIDSDRFSTGSNTAVFPTTPANVISSFVNNPLTRQYQPLAFARDFVTPERVYKWEAGITPKLWGGYDLGLSYSGNVGRRLPLAGIANQLVGVLTDPDPTKPATRIRQFDIVRDGQVFQPFGEFFYRNSKGRSAYNALVISLGRDRAKQLSEFKAPKWLVPAKFNVLYTLARSVGNVTGTVASNPLSFESDYGYIATDARHSFSLQMIYQLWQAHGKDEREGRKSWLWGWEFAPNITARTGLPLVVLLDRPDVVYVDASGNVFTGPGAGRRAVINTPGGGATGAARVPDLIPGVNPYLNKDLELLNPAAFAIPAPGTFGNLRRGALRGRGLFKVDLAVTRQLFGAGREEAKVSSKFKVEILNLFNRTNFANPTATLSNLLGTSSADNQIQPGMPFARAGVKTFGLFNAADTSRQIQFTLTFTFNEGFF